MRFNAFLKPWQRRHLSSKCPNRRCHVWRWCSLGLTLLPPVVCLLCSLLCSGPREDATRIGSAGVVRRQAVDVSPLRRVNQAIWLITTGARESAFRNIKTIAECLADELINAAKGSSNRWVREGGCVWGRLCCYKRGSAPGAVCAGSGWALQYEGGRQAGTASTADCCSWISLGLGSFAAAGLVEFLCCSKGCFPVTRHPAAQRGTHANLLCWLFMHAAHQTMLSHRWVALLQLRHQEEGRD